MPKNTVTDPITDQEMAFAHLIMSGTMNDRRAAEAVGLNPDTAAYTKSKPRVRAYMIEHRAAVREKLVDEEADRLRNLNLGRDRILTRLWELAALSSEATRGSIAGQIKALSMISAIEGFIPPTAASLHPRRNPSPRPAMRKSTTPAGDPRTSLPRPSSRPIPLPQPRPSPSRPASPSLRSPTMPANLTPSSSRNRGTGFPLQPPASLMSLWTQSTP